jgi:hypothetical protein
MGTTPDGSRFRPFDGQFKYRAKTSRCQAKKSVNDFTTGFLEPVRL